MSKSCACPGIVEPAATDAHQLNKGHYATSRQKYPGPPKRSLQSFRKSETLARLGLVVQLGQSGWSGAVLHFYCGNALDFEPSLWLGIAASAKRQTALPSLVVLFLKSI
jgi:hypothetical protein